jgi:hypothetical protein
MKFTKRITGAGLALVVGVASTTEVVQAEEKSNPRDNRLACDYL